jgi:outer membrane protein
MGIREIIVVVSLILLCGCVHLDPQLTSDSPASMSKPESQPTTFAGETPPVLALSDVQNYIRKWSLPELIDLALRNNPRTKLTWEQSKAAAAAMKSGQGAYYPSSNVGLQYSQNHQHQDVGGSSTVADTTNRGPYAEIDYVLFDFGRRGDRVEQLRQNLLAANYGHNAAVQDLIFTVQQGYFRYVALKALADAQQQAVGEANTNLSAAQERARVGQATLADVLQAQTALSRVQLVLETTRGGILVIRGAVATAVGIPPHIPVDVESISVDVLPVARIADDAQTLIKEAEEKSPVLSAVRAQHEKAKSRLAEIKTEGYPTLGAAGRIDELEDSGDWKNNYTAGLLLKFPLFTGFSHSYDVLQAEHELQAAKEQLEDATQQQAFAVWRDYSNFKTAAEQIKTSEALFASATQSHAVALGSYKEGVGSILDLLSAQSALQEARAFRIQAKVDWVISLAQLMRDIGNLESDSLQSTVEFSNTKTE